MQCYHKLPTQIPPERLIQTVGQHIMYPNTNIPHILSKLYQSCKSEHVRAAHNLIRHLVYNSLLQIHTMPIHKTIVYNNISNP